MMKKDVLILCEDLFGLEVYTILSEINGYAKKERINCDTYNIKGFISPKKSPFGNLKVTEPIITLLDDWNVWGDYNFVMGIKNPFHKEKMAERFHGLGVEFLTVLTPWTIVPDHYSIGEGCVISNYSFKENSVFGDFVTMINVMSESSKVGRYSTIDALANITNSEIGSYVMIGAHSFIMSDKKIEDASVIFPGSMVFGNVKKGSRIAGIPANKVRYKIITETIEEKQWKEI